MYSFPSMCLLGSLPRLNWLHILWQKHAWRTHTHIPGCSALGNCGTGKHSWGRQIGGFTHAYYLECMCSFSLSSKAVDGDRIPCGGHFSMAFMSTCHCPKRQINSIHMLPGPTRTKGMCCARTALLQTFKILAAVVLMQHDWRNEWRMPQHVSFCDLSSVTARADCLWTPRLCPTGPRVPSPFEDSDAFGGTLIVLLPSAREGACTAQQLPVWVQIFKPNQPDLNLPNQGVVIVENSWEILESSGLEDVQLPLFVLHP